MNLTRTRAAWVVLVAAACLVAGPTTVGGQDAGGGVITIPATSFSGEGGGKVSRSEPKGKPQSPFIHFWHTPGHWLEWVVDGVAAGEYRVAIRYAGRVSVKRGLTVNGSTVSGLESFTLPATGLEVLKTGWVQWSEATLPAPVTLASGRNVLRLTSLDDASVRVREIVLTAPNKPPVTIPAGQFSGQGGGSVQVITPPALGCVGGSWNEPWMAGGHWLEWTAEVPSAGRYGVGLHYRADGYCRLELQVNGEKVKGLEDFIPPKTGALENYTIGTLPAPVMLREGKNTLRLTILGGPRKVVPQFDGMLALSAIHLSPLAEGMSLGDNVLALSSMDELVRLSAQHKRAPKTIPPAPLGPPLPVVQGAVSLKEGQSFLLGRRKATVLTIDSLPYIENRFTKGAVWANYDDPMLKKLRETYKLDEVVAPGKNEYEKQTLLMKWIWEQWDHGHAQELYYLVDPVWILDESKNEHIFQCMHSNSVQMAAMASLGWICRSVGTSNHTWGEVWSNQYRKWMLFDATSNLRYERKGVPLSSYEAYHMRYVEQADDVMGLSEAGKKYTAPPRQGKTANMNILSTNTYVADRLTGPGARLEVGQGLAASFDPQDAYYPLNQAALALVPGGDDVKVTLGTMTPNFKEFRVRIDGGEWRPAETTFSWPLHSGKNRLEAVSVSRFGVEGPVSAVVINMDE